MASRGLMHSRTFEDVFKAVKYAEEELTGEEVELFMAHGMPQPDAQNDMAQRALEYWPEFLWFVDDDMLIPEGVLVQMLGFDADIVTARYPVGVNNHDAVVQRDGKFQFGGMGCTLVKSKVFEKLEKPYFRADKEYVWEGGTYTGYPARPDVEYHGLYDTDFYIRAAELGFNTVVTTTTCGQYETDSKVLGNHTNIKVREKRL